MDRIFRFISVLLSAALLSFGTGRTFAETNEAPFSDYKVLSALADAQNANQSEPRLFTNPDDVIAYCKKDLWVYHSGAGQKRFLWWTGRDDGSNEVAA